MLDLSRYATLGDKAHISLRSFRSNGEPVDTAVWYYLYENQYYIRTVRDSAKVRRLRANPRAAFASCRWNGDLLDEWQNAQALILTDDDPIIGELDRCMDAFYGDYRRELTALMKQLNKPLCYIKLTPLTEKYLERS